VFIKEEYASVDFNKYTFPLIQQHAGLQ